MMRKFLFIPSLLAGFIAILASCNKPHTVPVPANIDLSNKPLPEVKAVLAGTWQLHFLKGGFCGVCEYERQNEFYTFGINDHVKWTVDKVTMADTSLTWFQQPWLGKTINVMDFYAIDLAHHYLSPDFIKQDTLQMFEPGPDGMRYYFTKVK